jgi:O-antigen/teichoic acid export membrane protein
MGIKNSFLVNVGSMTGGGFIGGATTGIFWLVAARRFPIAAIGVAGGVASLAALVNVMTSIGFTGALVQNVPSRKGNGGLLLVGSLSSGLLSVAGSGVVVVVFVSIFGGSFRWFDTASLMLILSMLSASSPIGMMADVVAAPVGSVWFAPVRGIVQGALRIVAVLFVPLHTGAFGLDMAFAVPMVLTSFIGIALLSLNLNRHEHGFWPTSQQRKSYWHFSIHSLPSTMILSILPTAPPVLAVWILGDNLGGVFYICWNGFVIANLLVASATVLGISPDVPPEDLIRIVRRIASICSILMTVGGPIFLLAYGGQYFSSGWAAIAILGVALFPYSQEQLLVTLLRRDSMHVHTTRITAVLGVVCIVGLVVGAQLGSAWTMALGWLVAVTAILVAGFVRTQNGRQSNWLPTFPRIT